MLVAASQNVVAVERQAQSTGFYLGAGLGVVGFDDDDLSKDLGYDSGFPSAIDTESEDKALKLFAGYRFNNIASIEASFSDYGDTDYTYFKQAFMSLEIQSFSVAANLGYSFANGWRPFALIGLSYVDVDVDVDVDLSSSFQPSLSDSESYTGIHYGVGAEYVMSGTSGVTLRVALEGDLFVDNSFEDSYSPYFEDEYVLDAVAFYVGLGYRF